MIIFVVNNKKRKDHIYVKNQITGLDFNDMKKPTVTRLF